MFAPPVLLALLASARLVDPDGLCLRDHDQLIDDPVALRRDVEQLVAILVEEAAVALDFPQVRDDTRRLFGGLAAVGRPFEVHFVRAESEPHNHGAMPGTGLVVEYTPCLALSSLAHDLAHLLRQRTSLHADERHRDDWWFAAADSIVVRTNERILRERACGCAERPAEEVALIAIDPESSRVSKQSILCPGTASRLAALAARASKAKGELEAELAPLPQLVPIRPTSDRSSERALLSVNVVGLDACAVWVERERIGATPLFRRPAPAGTHTVFVRCPNGARLERRLELRPAEATMLVVTVGELR